MIDIESGTGGPIPGARKIVLFVAFSPCFLVTDFTLSASILCRFFERAPATRHASKFFPNVRPDFA